ncbi:hypothetical protein [Chitinimonas sp.]|uniref:hypothetical protein n=1 Tax=Chitinimonas sp. TaxID=1934313 RepID=UPI002F94887C
MFDYLDTPLPSFDNSSNQAESTPAVATRAPLALARQHAGRNWARFAARPGRQAALQRLREVALYLDARVEKLADGGLLVLGLSLNETLSLAERFGDELAVEAGIAGRAHYPA